MKAADYNKIPWKDLFQLSPETESGISKINSTRKVGWRNYKSNGKPSGWRLEFNGTSYYIHRIIWIILNGAIDNDLVINHIDCNPFNNNHDNLELCTSKANGQKHKCHQMIELRKENKSGYTGVSEANVRGIFYAKAQWNDTNGKLISKYFPYSKHGKEDAILLAVKARNDAIIDLNKNGACYPENKIIVNKFKTPDGTILISRNRHDYVSHFDSKENSWFGVDGGVSYQKITGDFNKLINLSVYSTDSHEKIRDNFEWTSYGKTGRDPAKTNLLKNLDTDHIEAIIETQVHLSDHILDVFKNELIYRTGVKNGT